MGGQNDSDVLINLYMVLGDLEDKALQTLWVPSLQSHVEPQVFYNFL